MKPVDHPRFTDLLPFFVNGTASEEDRSFVEACLLRHPEAESELRFIQALRQTVHDAEEERAAKGLARLLAESSTVPVKPARTESISEIVRSWCRDWGLSPAFAIAAAVVVAQGGLLIQRSGESLEPTGGYRGEKQVTVADNPTLKITFKPDAEFANVMDVLRSEHATIVRGPDEGGAMLVQLPSGADAATVVSRIMASGFADDVSPAPSNQ